MTATLTVIPTPQAALPDLKVTQLRVLKSEWTKFRSLRSTVWTLLIAVVLMVGLAALLSAVTNSQFHTLKPEEKATFNPIAASLGGISFAQLAIGVLGVLLISGEYSTGMIRASLTAVPKRLPVLWAKVAVYAGVVFVIMLASSFGAFLLGQALLGTHGVGLSAPGAVRSIYGAALYLTIAGTIGVAIGALIRNSAGGISAFVGLFFLAPPLSMLLPSSMSDAITPYLPSNAGGALYGGASPFDKPLDPWVGFAVLCSYAVVLVAAAAVRLRKSDA
ncbi:MAG: putative transporter transrane protein [Frankiales bacterium]|nr:putative transporter transrane protein [Frankiales bacterium]